LNEILLGSGEYFSKLKIPTIKIVLTKMRNRFIRVGLVLGVWLVLASCNKEGVCTACCGPSGNTYCKNGWTEAECKEWDDLKVNGLDWHFHKGQTCEARGTPATS